MSRPEHPWASDHDDDTEPTGAQLEAWSQAANYIAADGLTPILPVSVLRALYRRGGSDRELAMRIYHAGGAAA